LSENETGKQRRSERARKNPPAPGIDAITAGHLVSLLKGKFAPNFPLENTGGRFRARPSLPLAATDTSR